MIYLSTWHRPGRGLVCCFQTLDPEIQTLPSENCHSPFRSHPQHYISLWTAYVLFRRRLLIWWFDGIRSYRSTPPPTISPGHPPFFLVSSLVLYPKCLFTKAVAHRKLLIRDYYLLALASSWPALVNSAHHCFTDWL